MDRNNISKIAQNAQDKLLLAKLWDKINAGMLRNVPANTPFLTPREQEMARFLFGDIQGLQFFGGYGDAERKMLVYLPEYMDADGYFEEEDSPIWCLHADFYDGDSPTHKDFLGALMACGISRETLGDICVGTGSCDFFVTGEMGPYILQNLLSAGRAHLRLSRIPLSQVEVPEAKTREIRDTVASLRLDSILSSGFRISRSLAQDYIAAGKAAIDGLPCEKADKPVTEGMKISVRGLGKIKIKQVNGQTKKGRISVVIDRYV